MTSPLLAPAKINLCLHVTGRRDDDYHILDSIVVFTELGDRLTLQETKTMELVITGPFAQGVPNDARNLIWRAVEAASSGTNYKITLEKNLPHPAGIGGGSADAAAVLREIARRGGTAPCPQMALSLGADVPVCLDKRPQRMRGIGQALDLVPNFPSLHLALVNPRIAVPTGQVFNKLTKLNNAALRSVQSDDWVSWLKVQRNDLQAPAQLIAPVISEVLDALDNRGAELTRMSGSGATCFGIFKTAQDAQDAATALKQKGWWSEATSTFGCAG